MGTKPVAVVTLDAVLDECARRVTGHPDATARPGQSLLAADIDRAMSSFDPLTGLKDHVAGQAPTGCGKSFAYLAPAMMRAALSGERTVIATESLALQSQIMDKDAPLVCEVVRDMCGQDVPIAVLKGISNYVCPLAAVGAAETFLTDQGRPLPDVEGTREVLISFAEAVEATPVRHQLAKRRSQTEVNLGTGGVKISHMKKAISWALRASCSCDPHEADKAQYTSEDTVKTWPLISATTAECVGKDSCPFTDLCPPQRAKTLATTASVVVTNHAMLGVQASKDIPVVVGSASLGVFDHIVVDEAHALPGVVRSQGSCDVSATRITSLCSTLRNATSRDDKDVVDILSEGEKLAQTLETVLSSAVSKPGEVVPINHQDNPLGKLGVPLLAWVRKINTLAASISTGGAKAMIAARRITARAENLAAAIKTVETHAFGVARWLEVDTRGGRSVPAAKASPVDVGPALSSCLWASLVPFEEGTPLIEENRWIIDETLTRPRYALSVCAVSGTLPDALVFALGLKTKVREYPSPFTCAYDQSRLYVPQLTSQDDIDTVLNVNSRGRMSLDTRSHTKWAGDMIASLVAASEGSALILAATVSNGREYVALLRERFAGQFQVFSQWDATSVPSLVQSWRLDPSSVLVGTRSLMTGTDAPGQTCRLVIVDRVPRSASNPVDDARVEAISARLDISRWDADRLVYVADAALLLEQCAGRLVRSVDDQGVVAVLDPRLLRNNPVAYPEPTRRVYLKALSAFTQRTTNLDEASDYLHTLARTALAQAA